MRLAERPKGERPFLASVVVAVGLNPFNSSLISIVLVLIANSLHVPLEHALWLIGGFYITSAIAQPIFGSLADRISAYPLFVGGLLAVCLASVLGGCAQNIGMLTAGRVLLALGTSAAYPATIVMVRTRYPGRSSPSAMRVLNLIAVTQQVAAALGPPLGGLLVGAFGWRIAFFVNIPLAIGGIWVGHRAQKRTESPPLTVDETATPGPAPLDPVGSILFALTLGLIFVATSGALLPTPAALVALPAAAGLLVWWEMRATVPLVDVRLLASNPALAWIFVRFLAAGVVLYAMMILWPQWLQQSRGIPVEQVGLLLLPMSLVAPAIAVFAGRKWHYRTSLFAGHLGLVSGSVALLTMGSQAPVWLMLGCVASFALPTALLQLANQAAVFEATPPEQTGASVGLLRSAWYIGAIVASALGGIFFGEEATTNGLHRLAAAMCTTSLTIVIIDVTVLVRNSRRSNRLAVRDPVRP